MPILQADYREKKEKALRTLHNTFKKQEKKYFQDYKELAEERNRIEMELKKTFSVVTDLKSKL